MVCNRELILHSSVRVSGHTANGCVYDEDCTTSRHAEGTDLGIPPLFRSGAKAKQGRTRAISRQGIAVGGGSSLSLGAILFTFFTFFHVLERRV